MNSRLGWILVGAGLVAGYFAYGWRGVALALSVTAFWLMLQFTRALRTMRLASAAPVGHVDSAVMLQSKLHAGMTMLQVLPLTRSLGQVVGDPAAETYRWIDAGGGSVQAVFGAGRLKHWALERENTAATEA